MKESEALNVDLISYADVAIFLKYLHEKVLSQGLLDALISYECENGDKLHACVKSWLHGIMAGYSVPVSLRMMRPAFPPLIEDLLFYGITNGVVDYLLSDVLSVLNSSFAILEIDNSLAALMCKYSESNRQLCLGEECFKREILKIVRRSKCEEASEVVLEQLRDYLFSQKYISTDLVQIVVSSHADIQRELFDHLDKISSLTDPIVCLDGVRYSISHHSDRSFTLLSDCHRLILYFR